MAGLNLSLVKPVTLFIAHETQNINQLFYLSVHFFPIKIRKAFAEMTTGNDDIFWTQKFMARPLCQDVGAPFYIFSLAFCT